MAFPSDDYVVNYSIDNYVDLGFSPDSYLRIVDIVISVVRVLKGNVSDEDIADYAEERMNGIVSKYQKRFDEYQELGQSPLFMMDLEDEKVPRLKFINNQLSDKLRRIRSMPPKDFEALCRSLLARMGAKTLENVGGTKDGGVDFVAYDLAYSSHADLIPKHCKVVVLGQAKRYKDSNIVSEIEVRSFVGGAIRMKYKHFSDRPDLVSQLQPTVYAFWTTSFFNSSAKNYCDFLGIWSLDGLAIVSLLDRLGIVI